MLDELCPGCRSGSREFRDKLWISSPGTGLGMWCPCDDPWHNPDASDRWSAPDCRKTGDEHEYETVEICRRCGVAR